MRNLIFGLVLINILACNSNLNTENNHVKKQDSSINHADSNKVKANIENEKVSYKFSYGFIKSKIENDYGTKNKMELYYFTGDMLIDTVKMICKKKKHQWNSEGSFYIVFFDNKKYAIFPRNPFSALYGGLMDDLDNTCLKHIRGYYEYKVQNGYSKLSLYADNAYESPEVTFDIE